mgnify:CR=1 FL=1
MTRDRFKCLTWMLAGQVGLAGVFLIIALAIFLPMWEMGALMG